MCLGDWRLGLLTRAVPRTVTITNADGYTIPANPERVGLSFTYVDGATTSAQFVRAIVDGQIFEIVGFQAPRYFITMLTDGDLPTKKFVIVPEVDDNYNYVEYFLPREYLTAGLAEFRSKYKW